MACYTESASRARHYKRVKVQVLTPVIGARGVGRERAQRCTRDLVRRGEGPKTLREGRRAVTWDYTAESGRKPLSAIRGFDSLNLDYTGLSRWIREP